jgi:hypothetical protein
MRLFTDEPDIIALGRGIMILTALLQPFQSSFQIYAARSAAPAPCLPSLSMDRGHSRDPPSLSNAFVTIAGWGLSGMARPHRGPVHAVFLIRPLRYKSGKWRTKTDEK